MKTLLLSCISSLLVFGAVTASAIPYIGSHHVLYINGSLLTQVPGPGKQTAIVTTPINNASIIAAVLQSGSFPGVLAKNVVITMNDVTAEIDVFDTVSHTVLFVLGYDNGSATTDGEVHAYTPKNGSTGYESISGFSINLPNVAGPASVDLYLNLLKTDYNAGEFQRVSATFSGGYGEGTPGVYVLHGTANSGLREITFFDGP